MSISTLLNSLESAEKRLEVTFQKLKTDQTPAQRAKSERDWKTLTAKVEAIKDRIELEREHKAKMREERFKAKAERDRYVATERKARAEEKAKYRAEKQIRMAEIRKANAEERKAMKRAKAIQVAEATMPTAVQAWLGR